MPPRVVCGALQSSGPCLDLAEYVGVEDDDDRHGHQVQHHIHARGPLWSNISLHQL